MQLYGYQLRPYNGIFKTEIVEVEEKAKTYKGDFGLTCGSVCNKSDIGRLMGISKNIIYFLEPNVALAKSILKNKYVNEYQDALNRYNICMKALS